MTVHDSRCYGGPCGRRWDMVMARMVDLRGDSCGGPTEEMREAMRTAAPYDYGESSPDVSELEESCAALFGKQSGLFVPTVTMANLITVMATCPPGHQVAVDRDAHLYADSYSGVARLAGVMPLALPRKGALPDPEQVSNAFADPRPHAESIALVWTENTHEFAGGAVAAPGDVRRLKSIAVQNGATLAMDGARIFDAAAYLGIPVAELVADADWVSVGFAKALCAPAGAVLVGPKDGIAQARRLARVLGGHLVKAGAVAAACLSGLRTLPARIPISHRIAQQLGELVAATPGFTLAAPVMTNLIRIDVSQLGNAVNVAEVLARHGILTKPKGNTVIRMTTNRVVSEDDVSVVGAALAAVSAAYLTTVQRVT